MTIPFAGVYNRFVENEKVSLPLPPAGPSLAEARRFVAGALLARAGDGSRPRLTVRDVVIASGTDWEAVRLSLRSLQEEGAIRLERHRLFIRRDLLRQAAAAPASGSRA
jgi:hypothetical protein